MQRLSQCTCSESVRRWARSRAANESYGKARHTEVEHVLAAEQVYGYDGEDARHHHQQPQRRGHGDQGCVMLRECVRTCALKLARMRQCDRG